jgi:deoxyribonuclease-4
VAIVEETRVASEVPAREFEDEDAYVPVESGPPPPPAWMDGSLRMGIHTSIAGDIVQSLEIAHRLGANALQIFSASPRMWHVGGRGDAARRITEAEAGRFRARREELKLGPLAIHANYLINLAAPDTVLRVRSIQAFHDELVRAGALGAEYLIVHPGSGRGTEPREAIRRVVDSLRQAARRVTFGPLRILLENTAGQGAVIGSRLEELKEILDGAPELPLGVCLDTAHLLAAGYNIATPEGLERTLDAVDATVQLQRVYVVHMNDSKARLGSRLDRHEHIGKGHIGREAFRRMLNHPQLTAPIARFDDGAVLTRAFLLETPIDRPGDDARNVRALWALVGRKINASGDGMKPRVRRGTTAKAKVSRRGRKGTRRSRN